MSPTHCGTGAFSTAFSRKNVTPFALFPCLQFDRTVQNPTSRSVPGWNPYESLVSNMGISYVWGWLLKASQQENQTLPQNASTFFSGTFCWISVTRLILAFCIPAKSTQYRQCLQVLPLVPFCLSCGGLYALVNKLPWYMFFQLRILQFRSSSFQVYHYECLATWKTVLLCIALHIAGYVAFLVSA